MAGPTITENVELAPYTTLKIGGRARFFVDAVTEADITGALAFARERGLPVFVLGGGSNVLIADSGYDGLVVRIGIRGVEAGDADEDGSVLVTAAAGEDWDGFVDYCVRRGLAGVECLRGIPGLVGGTPVQNVGAYGQEVSETIVTVRCLDRETDRPVTLSNADCGFTYRTSIFNSIQRGRYIVLSVDYRLVAGGRPKIVYRDIVEHFDGREPSLAETREAVLAIRRAKSMVIDDADPNSRSAGSFFKNPIVPLAKFDEIRGRYDSVPQFAVDDGHVKIPAAWMIERSGFAKGHSMGPAGISTKHTLALINRDNATAEDILSLKTSIQVQVFKTFGIELQPEPVFVGFDD